MPALMDWLLSVPTSARWIITLIFAAIVIALSISPGVEQPGDNLFVWVIVRTPTLIQKIMHVATYAALALSWMWTLASIESRLLRIALTIIATIGLGAILEWQQTRVPGRFGTVFDVALNAIGALIGLALALLLL
jgi:hypothetical protein